MRVIWMRHAESEGNVDQTLYADGGDFNMALTDTGWNQAFAAGRFLDNYYSKHTGGQWPRTYVSPYLRGQQTLSGIFNGVKNIAISTTIIENALLAERHHGSLSILHRDADLPEGDPRRAQAREVLDLYYEVLDKDPYNTRAPMGESLKDMKIAYKVFQGTLYRALDKGYDNLLSISHSDFLKLMMVSRFQMPVSKMSKIKTPGNCDMFEIAGRPGQWTLRQIYDGQAMKAVDNDPLAGIPKLTTATLPPPPEHIRKHWETNPPEPEL